MISLAFIWVPSKQPKKEAGTVLGQSSFFKNSCVDNWADSNVGSCIWCFTNDNPPLVGSGSKQALITLLTELNTVPSDTSRASPIKKLKLCPVK